MVVHGLPDDCKPSLPEVPAIDKQSLDYVVRSGLAGGMAGCAAKTLIAPLDRVKILFQTRNPAFQKYAGRPFGLGRALGQIVQDQGIIGLFKGHSATLLRVFPYAGIKFVAYEQFRALLIRSRSEEIYWRRFLSGSLSGVTSVFFTYPLDVIRVRLAYDTSKTAVLHPFFRVIRKIGTSDGTSNFRIRNFYSGFVPTILGMIPYAGVSFLAHDACHDLFRSRLFRKRAVDWSKPANAGSRRPLNTWAELCAGGLSGMLAQTASYPLEIVRRRMQVSGSGGPGLLKTVVKIYGESGLRGFFVGLSIGYIKVIPMFACSFYVYERAKYWVGI